MAFRFIHTADWQIGKPFANIPGDAGAELRTQRIKTVERIAEHARRFEVDAVLVAGDVFDSNEVSDRTIARTLAALAGFAGPWILLPGNHDAALAHSVWTRIAAAGAPAHVTIADTASPIDLWHGRAVVLPAPLRRRRETADQTAWFDAAPSAEGACRIGLAHGSVAGRLPEAAESANDIAPDRADRAGLAYLGLGDWHGSLRIAPRTWYAGTPEPDRHRANAAGQILLIEADGAAAPERVQPVPIGHFRWERREVELIDGTCEAALAVLADLASDAGRCVASLRLSGTISLAERRRLDRELTVLAARAHHLDIEDGLIDEPTPDDLDALDTGGFVRLAVDRLRARADDPADPDRDAARMALRMMFLDHSGRE